MYKSRCSELQQALIVSGGEPFALLQSEVLSHNDEERKSLLKETGISDEIKIGPAEVLAIKAGLPFHGIRYDCLEGVEIIMHIIISNTMMSFQVANGIKCVPDM